MNLLSLMPLSPDRKMDNKTYRIEEEGTNGWAIFDQEYQHLTKERCSELLEQIIAKGTNPNYLRVIRDDVQSES